MPNVFFIVHVGDYPIFDLSMSINDFDELRGRSVEEYLSRTHFTKIGNLSPHTSSVFRATLLPEERRSIRLSISFAARNGHYYEDLRLRRTDQGKTIFALQVRVHKDQGRSPGNDLVHEMASEGFQNLEDEFIEGR